jgi:hypothetical protein
MKLAMFRPHSLCSPDRSPPGSCRSLGGTSIDGDSEYHERGVIRAKLLLAWSQCDFVETTLPLPVKIRDLGLIEELRDCAEQKTSWHCLVDASCKENIILPREVL